MEKWKIVEYRNGTPRTYTLWDNYELMIEDYKEKLLRHSDFRVFKVVSFDIDVTQEVLRDSNSDFENNGRNYQC